MGTAVLEMPKGVCAPCEIGTLGAFFEPSSTHESTLISKEVKLIAELVGVLDKQLLAALGARSLPEFSDVRKTVWPKYIRSVRALQDTFSNLIPEGAIERTDEQVITELEADLEKQRGEARFGNALTDQAIFTLWTLGKIRSLAREICASGEVSPEKKQADEELISEYRVHSLWAQFHLDILVAAMKFALPIAEDVRGAIRDGLRASVNAYAIMKEALRLRPSAELFPVTDLPWDAEDDRLLASSMRDINAFSAD
jgi:hypothetical protein